MLAVFDVGNTGILLGGSWFHMAVIWLLYGFTLVLWWFYMVFMVVLYGFMVVLHGFTWFYGDFV